MIFTTKLSWRWSYSLAGLATGFGLSHLALAPTQALFYLVMANLKVKEDPGLAGLIFFVPTVIAITGALFQSLIYSFIGYRLGRREELAKQVGSGRLGVAELTKENIFSIFLDALGIFIAGGFLAWISQFYF